MQFVDSKTPRKLGKPRLMDLVTELTMHYFKYYRNIKTFIINYENINSKRFYLC